MRVRVARMDFLEERLAGWGRFGQNEGILQATLGSVGLVWVQDLEHPVGWCRSWGLRAGRRCQGPALIH